MNADKGVAAVTNHDGECNCQDSHWKKHCVCGVSIGTEIVSVCNKYLVNNVVKCRCKHRNNAK